MTQYEWLQANSQYQGFNQQGLLGQFNQGFGVVQQQPFASQQSSFGSISGAYITPQERPLTGTKHVVVCNGSSTECDSLKDAQANAEELAAYTQRNAYVLKPISVTKPKRETVTEPIE